MTNPLKKIKISKKKNINIYIKQVTSNLSSINKMPQWSYIADQEFISYRFMN